MFRGDRRCAVMIATIVAVLVGIVGWQSLRGRRDDRFWSLAEHDRIARAIVVVYRDGVRAGTGFVLSGNHLVTAAHVSRGSDALEVELWDGSLFRATERSAQPDADVAELQVSDAVFQRATALEPSVEQAGTQVALVAELGTESRATVHGVLGYQRVWVWLDRAGDYGRHSLISGSVIPPASGGPWLDRSGRVVAIQSGTMGSPHDPGAFSTATPVSVIDGLGGGLRMRERGLGVKIESTRDANSSVDGQAPPRSGMRIIALASWSPLREFLLEPGDIIRSIDGHELRTRARFHQLVRDRPGVGEVVLVVERSASGVDETFRVQLAEIGGGAQ